jgi:hypothetical protein
MKAEAGNNKSPKRSTALLVKPGNSGKNRRKLPEVNKGELQV